MSLKRKPVTAVESSQSSKRFRISEWLSDAEDDSGESSGGEVDEGALEGKKLKKVKEDESSTEDEGSLRLVDTSLSFGGVQRVSQMANQPQRVVITSKRRSLSQESSIPIHTTNFTELGVHPGLVTTLATMSIRKPTPVQAACIPPLLQGLDCIGNAKTGSGKTVAFAIPILQKLMQDPYGIYALVLTPTRELAFQIADQFTVLGGPFNARTAVIVGGMDMIAQAKELEERPHIVVATPGRLVDHLNSTSGTWNLSRIKFLVLDEADRLLTPTFAPELAALFQVLPTDRQTSLFTATISEKIEDIANAPPKPGKSKPFVHRMTDRFVSLFSQALVVDKLSRIETVTTLKQYYLLVPSHVREVYLYYLLCNPPSSIIHLRRAPPEKVKPGKDKKGSGNKKKPPKQGADTEDEVVQPPPTIIFCTRPKAAAYLTEFLKALSIRATALHSRLTQRERLTSLNLFRAYVVPVLVSTDVGARGLDIDDVALVVNWDMPVEPEEYTHRVGRTARRGRGGIAVSFVTERDEERVKKVEERIGTSCCSCSCWRWGRV
ncbi:putative RNA helicase [Serendipita sp. 401]|nr:putative RNA helicase [Serendipita sp. 401]